MGGRDTALTTLHLLHKQFAPHQLIFPQYVHKLEIFERRRPNPSSFRQLGHLLSMCKAAYFTLNWQNQLESIKQAHTYTCARKSATHCGFFCAAAGSATRCNINMTLSFSFFLIWQGVERFYCRGNYIYGPWIYAAIFGRCLCMRPCWNKPSEAKINAFSCLHKVFWLQCRYALFCSTQLQYFPSSVMFFSLFLFCTWIHSLRPVICCFVCPPPSTLSRVAVIRGSVALQDGSPLVGVNITFPQHPEYGYTVSRQDGR